MNKVNGIMGKHTLRVVLQNKLLIMQGLCVNARKPLSFVYRVRPSLLRDGCFLRAGDFIQEVAWGSAHTEVADTQKTAHLRTPTRLQPDI